ncbi:MAG: hypothetical protein JWM38_1239 [Sphingomonas bacterium]|nr:hypothetical protein [Sphingomonas bacterium]MDB5663178.1 hypothetical protein [Sphingomonas bacterium]MDB5685288.1 hypothetical protein [Sphingomonas bacterium]MDB5685295.1 hypothetical protein [Sphingomonas bacterium]MDB5717812.1 hypothetical protein [Sphingomonas bacterium]
MSRTVLRPYLVAKDAEGQFRVTIRSTRFNSQGYPLVTSTLLDDAFPTATAAKLYVREQLKGETGDIATK